MSWNTSIRQIHRWLSITFTLAVIANFAVMGQGKLAFWVGALTLVPLGLLLVTGLYMFFLPHVSRWRSGRRMAGVNHEATAARE